MPSPTSAISSSKPKRPSSRSDAARQGWRRFGRLLRVHGHSMAPVLRPGQLVLIREDAYDAEPPRHGDIVAARPACFGGRALIKRLVGLPGERVRIDAREWQLGEDEYFLLGDRGEHSFDSRIFGPVSRQELIGPVRLALWPWKRLVPLSPGDPAAPTIRTD